MLQTLLDNKESVVIAFIGLFLVAFFFYTLYFYNVIIKKWQTTKGIIVRNEAVYKYSKESKNNWKNTIVFEYTVGNKHYQSNGHIAVSQTYAFKTQVVLNEKYPVGSEVTVYYNPSNPVRSVIEKELNPLFAVLGSMGVIFLAVAYYIWK